MIYYSVTKPIKSISDEIHSANLTSNSTLTTTKNNKDDEIGRLVQDTNDLIIKLKNLADSEYKLRVRQEQSEQQLRMIFEKTGTGIVLMNQDMQIISFNPAFIQMLNIPHDQINDFKKPNLYEILVAHTPLLKTKLLGLQVKNEPVTFVIDLYKNQTGEKINKQKWLEVTLLGADAHNIQDIFVDITNHKLAEMAAVTQSEHDVLTNLYNRRGFEPRLTQSITEKERDTFVAILLIDLDGFKHVNDQYGHAAGDAVLIEVSRRLETTIRDGDLVARLGGDEFVVVLHQIKSYAKAGVVANKIIKIISQPIIFEAQSLQVGASIGVVLNDHNHVNAETLLKQADASMYKAKQAGKSRYHLFT